MPAADPFNFMLLAIVGAVAGFLNVLAGGGSALTIPLMIFLGYDATVANGSNRIAIQVEALTAVAAYKKQKHSDFPFSLRLSLMTLPGGILGAFYAVKIDDALFTKILGVVMILIIITLIFPKSEVIEHAKNNKWSSCGMDLIKIDMHKVFIVMVFTVPAVIMFIWTGNVNWFAAVALSIGMMAGTFAAVKVSLKKGEKFVRLMLGVSLLIIAVKLFLM